MFSTQAVMAKKADCAEKEKEVVAINFAKQMIDGGYKAVSTEDLKKWIDNKKPVLIVDTMPYEKSYKKNHIPGAVQFEFPIPAMNTMDDKKKAEFVKLLGADKNRVLVFYCGYTECTRSHNGALWALLMGYKNVYRCPGGISGWADAGYPVAQVK
jgi:rhodanese-related sulfurtransferase